MRRYIVSGILGTAILALMSIVAATTLWPDTAIAAGLHGLHRLHGSSRGGHEAHMAGAERGHCTHLDDKHTRLAAAYLKITLDLSDDQQTSLEPVINVLDEWSLAARSTCDNLNLDTAPAALAELEIILSDTQSAIARLRPAFDTFYGSLTAEQTDHLNGWIGHHHHTPES